LAPQLTGILRKLSPLRWLIGGGIILLIISQADLSLSMFTDVEVDYLALAVAFNVLTLALATGRSLLVFRALDRRVPFDLLGPAVTVGLVFGGLTPAASGEVLRADALRSRAGVPLADVLVLIAFERGVSLLLLIVTSACIALALLLPVPTGTVALPVVGVIAVIPPLTRRLSRLVPSPGDHRSAWLSGVLSHLHRLALDLERLLCDRQLLVRWSCLTVLMFAVSAAQVWLLTRAVGASTTLEAAWLAFAISQLAGLLSLLPFGIGVSDGSLTATLVRSGLTTDQAVATAVLVRAAVALPLILSAAVSYLYLSLRRKEARLDAASLARSS
jgi:uncharacterized protein (TIRG00374 family)